MALFALVVSIIGVVVAAVGAYFAKRSADAADASRIAAETSHQPGEGDRLRLEPPMISRAISRVLSYFESRFDL
jgi:hypothetical protein